jgi:hypothetical protein
VTYRLTANAGGAFQIDPATGVVTVANGALLDVPGTRSITVEALDGAGGTSARTFTVTITPALAVRITGTPVPDPREGTAITLGTEVTAAGTGVTYLWTVRRNGSAYPLPAGTATTGPTLAFVPDDNGAYTVKVEVTRGGRTVSDAVTVAVANVDPAAAVTAYGQLAGVEQVPGADLTGVQGLGVALTGTATDAGAADRPTLQFKWTATRRQGTADVPVSLAGSDTAAGRLVFAPTEPGTYTVTLKVTDKDGGTTSVRRTVEIVRAAGVRARPDPFDPAQARQALVVGGTDGNDKVQFFPDSGAGAVRVKLNGADSSFLGVGRVVVFTQVGDDDVQFAGGVTLRTYVDGGAGKDRLKGGGGANVLVGGDGDDVLIGGDARDVLVGGFGSDRLVGNAQDDILIAGNTDHDTNAVALDVILTRWLGSADFNARVASLSTGAGALLTTQTVHNDNAADVLTGDTGLDWYIFNADGADPATRDRTTDMDTYEATYTDDVAFMNEL